MGGSRFDALESGPLFFAERAHLVGRLLRAVDRVNSDDLDTLKNAGETRDRKGGYQHDDGYSPPVPALNVGDAG